MTAKKCSFCFGKGTVAKTRGGMLQQDTCPKCNGTSAPAKPTSQDRIRELWDSKPGDAGFPPKP